jgi:uncharacterized protein YacL
MKLWHSHSVCSNYTLVKMNISVMKSGLLEIMCGCFGNCVGVLVICVLVFTEFCIVCTVLFNCFLCIFFNICFACTSVRSTATE